MACAAVFGSKLDASEVQCKAPFGVSNYSWASQQTIEAFEEPK